MHFFLKLSLLLPTTLLAQFEKITFPAADGLEVTADLYRADEALGTPMIVLFHQANSSRGEYREIAPRLVRMGFNCLAVDQRSGGTRNGVANETAARAEGSPGFAEAIPDLEAAIAKAKTSYANGPVIIWGSSYSSSLVLKFAAEQPALATGVLSFSPGEYFQAIDANYIKTAVANLQGPVFVTSATSEAASWQAIFEAILSDEKVSFLPDSGGRHGSSTLYPSVPESESYWEAVGMFLKQWQPVETGRLHVMVTPMDAGKISLSFSGTEGAHYRVSVSRDLKRWLALASVTATLEAMRMVDVAEIERSNLFYRAEPIDAIVQPVIENVTALGSPGSYSFSVTIRSEEIGWERYADWWEVLDEKGDLLYRRVLAHPHVTEQPFTRPGGPVNITADQTVWIRAHMNDGGYGKAAFKGSVNAGFQAVQLSSVFGSEAAVTGALPALR